MCMYVKDLLNQNGAKPNFSEACNLRTVMKNGRKTTLIMKYLCRSVLWIMKTKHVLAQ